MVWAKLSDTFYDDPALLALPRDDRLFLVEATTWACKHETDGVFPLASVGRFSDTPEPAQTLARLVDAGLIEVVTETEYELVGFLDDQRSKVDIDKDRAEARFRQQRKRLHDKGDHSTCTRGSFCPAGQIEYTSRRDERAKSRPPVPTRPDPQGGTRGTSGADAPPPQRSGAVTPQKLVRAVLDVRGSYPSMEVLADAIAGVLTQTDAERRAKGVVRAESRYTELALSVLKQRADFDTLDDLAEAIVDAFRTRQEAAG